MEIIGRRSFISMLMAAPVFGLAMGVGHTEAVESAIPGLRPELLPPLDQIWSWVRKVNTELGPQRLTSVSDLRSGWQVWIGGSHSGAIPENHLGTDLI